MLLLILQCLPLLIIIGIYIYVLFIVLLRLLYLLLVDGVLPIAGAENMLQMLLIDAVIDTLVCTVVPCYWWYQNNVAVAIDVCCC